MPLLPNSEDMFFTGLRKIKPDDVIFTSLAFHQKLKLNDNGSCIKRHNETGENGTLKVQVFLLIAMIHSFFQ